MIKRQQRGVLKKKTNNIGPIVFGDLSVNRLSSSVCVCIVYVFVIETDNEPWKTRRAYKCTRHLCSGGGPKSSQLYYMYINGALSSLVRRYWQSKECDDGTNDYATSRWKRVWRAFESWASLSVSTYNNYMSKTVFQ